MEEKSLNNLNTQSPGLFELGLDENGKASLRNASVIGGIAAIFGIVNVGLGVVKFFISKARPAPEGFESYRTNTSTGGGSIISILISLTIGFLLFYFLNKFSNQVKTGLATSNSPLITEGFGNLANYFKTVGIILIIVLCFIVLAVLAGLAGTAVSR
jgi:small-conductance mechanosensitive channel